MNLGQNKLFVGLGAALLVGCVGFGWMLFQASSNFSAADARYTEQKEQLDRLQTLPLYPKPENLKILENQKKVAAEAAINLNKELVPMAFPLVPLTPEQFQDQLTATVKKLTDKAASNGVLLSDKLYLGFADYRTATPKPEAAAVLGRQLKCIELAVDTLIERKVASIDKITRPPLVEEQDASKTPTAAPTPKGKPAPGKPELLSKYPFEIEFVAEQRAFQGALNDLSKTDKQFFIVQPLLVKNQASNAPKKINSAPAAPAPVAPGATPKAEQLKYVLGAEKLNVVLRIDSVVFASNLPK